MTAHSILAPSSAHRWVECPGSVRLEQEYPEREESESSREGTAAHWVAEQALRSMPVPAIGSLAPNGVAVTDEMLEGAELVLRTVGGVASSLGDVRIEQRVSMPRIHPDNWGTPDYVYWASPRELWIWDYKFGHGLVEARGNWQLIDYAAGVVEQMLAPANGGGAAALETDITVHLVVIQPRSYHATGPVRSWTVNAASLRPYYIKLERAALEALGDAPRHVPTPEGCKHCTGRHACEALQSSAWSSVDVAYSYSAGNNLRGAALGRELKNMRKAAELLAARVSGLEEEVEARLRRGEQVVWWGMESVPGKLDWSAPEAEVDALATLMGVDLAKPRSLITPTQAKKLLPAAVVDQYSARRPSAVKLAEVDGSASSIFNDTGE